MEKKIDWKRKVTSRKLWVSICGFVSMLVVAMGGTESDAAQVSAIIMAGATVVGYVIGEGLADASNNLSDGELIQNTDLTNIRD
ncbi:MAG: hypothetical protein HFH60_02665 [Lachnospiraceae bacterium]|nr:hypothetical protein [Lachnospiraceae bacterium]